MVSVLGLVHSEFTQEFWSGISIQKDKPILEISKVQQEFTSHMIVLMFLNEFRHFRANIVGDQMRCRATHLYTYWIMEFR